MQRLISEFQAGALGRPVDVDLARGQREHFLDDLQRFPKCARGHVRAEIQGPVVLHATHDRETREILLHRQAKKRVVLVIAQHHVEPGAMAFDQVAFEQEGFQFGARDDCFDVPNQGRQHAGLGARVVPFLKIRTDPVRQYPGFSDVEDFTALAFQQVHAGAGWAGAPGSMCAGSF